MIGDGRMGREMNVYRGVLYEQDRDRGGKWTGVVLMHVCRLVLSANHSCSVSVLSFIMAAGVLDVLWPV